MKPLALRILIVEDELLIRWSLAEVLVEAGHVVAVAGDAEEALRELSIPDRSFDVVLLDVRLPDCRDFTLLRAIRRLAPAAAIIVMTAYGTPELAEEGLRLGARAVLDKPFDIAVVEPALWQAHTANPPRPS